MSTLPYGLFTSEITVPVLVLVLVLAAPAGDASMIPVSPRRSATTRRAIRLVNVMRPSP